MKKAAIAVLYVVSFAGTLWAAGFGPFEIPQFSDLPPSTIVAIGDTKITDDDSVADEMVNAQGQMAAPRNSQTSSDFSVTLMPAHGTKLTKNKKTYLSKSMAKIVAKAVAFNKVSDGNFTIQLSSYQTEMEAKNAADKFQKSKLGVVWVSTAQVAGKTWYRVYSGRFKTVAEARAAQSKVAQDSGVKEAFVQKVFTKLTAKND